MTRQAPLRQLFGAQDAHRDFVHHQLLRGKTRGTLLLRGVRAVAFWSIAIIGGAWLVDVGLTAVPVLLLLGWLVLMAPAVYIQSRLILDLITVKTLKRVWMYPRFVSGVVERIVFSDILAPHVVGRRKPPLIRRLRGFAGLTSPLDPLATWAFLVLLRIPALTAIAKEAEERAQIQAKSILKRIKKEERRASTRRKARATEQPGQFDRARALYEAALHQRSRARRVGRRGRGVVERPSWEDRAVGDEMLEDVLTAI